MVLQDTALKAGSYLENKPPHSPSMMTFYVAGTEFMPKVPNRQCCPTFLTPVLLSVDTQTLPYVPNPSFFHLVFCSCDLSLSLLPGSLGWSSLSFWNAQGVDTGRPGASVNTCVAPHTSGLQ